MWKDHKVQLPDHLRAKQNLKDVIESIIQMPTEHCQSWGINHLGRKPVKPVPVFNHMHGK